jgi:hypothetical protein
MRTGQLTGAASVICLKRIIWIASTATDNRKLSTE